MRPEIWQAPDWLMNAPRNYRPKFTASPSNSLLLGLDSNKEMGRSDLEPIMGRRAKYGHPLQARSVCVRGTVSEPTDQNLL